MAAIAPEKMMTRKEVADIFNVTERTIQRWVAGRLLKEFKAVKGGQARYRPSDVQALVESRTRLKR